MIQIPSGTDSMDLDGEDSAEEPEASTADSSYENKPARPFKYVDAEQWLHMYALPRYLRKLGSNRKWAPNWFEYPEAYSLITALWESWEQMRWDGPQQILVFYRDYFYPLMDRLTAMDGPFHAYDKTTHTGLPDTFPVMDAPPGYFRQGQDTE